MWNKQWQRLGGNKQTVLIIDQKFEFNSLKLLSFEYNCEKHAFNENEIIVFLDKTLLHKVLKKFTFINELSFNCIIDGEVLQIICNYCQYLRKISFNGLKHISEEQLISFGNKCGNKLQVIEVNENSDLIKPLFAFIPNIKSISFGFKMKNGLHFENRFSLN